MKNQCVVSYVVYDATTLIVNIVLELRPSYNTDLFNSLSELQQPTGIILPF